MKRIPLLTLWNFVQFQLGWFALVLSAAAGMSWLGLTVLTLLVAVHLRWFATGSEWRLLLLAGAGGWLWESLVHGLGLITFTGYSADALLAPLWMAGLWVNFATTLNHSLAWLKGQPFIAALLGGAGGPLAFLAGVKLGAATFTDPVLTTLVLVVAWSVLTPLVVYLAQRCEARRSNSVIGSVLEGN